MLAVRRIELPVGSSAMSRGAGPWRAGATRCCFRRRSYRVVIAAFGEADRRAVAGRARVHRRCRP